MVKNRETCKLKMYINNKEFDFSVRPQKVLLLFIFYNLKVFNLN